MTRKLDKALGLDRPITRRDFIYGGSLAIGGAVSGCAEDRPPVDVDIA